MTAPHRPTPLPRLALVTLLVITLCAQTACVRKVFVKTTPYGAKATLDDGRELGETPLTLSADTWAWTEHRITLAKEGYKPETLVIDAGPSPAHIAVCAIASCAIWMLWPVCLVGRHDRSDYAVRLTRDSTYSDDAFSLNAPRGARRDDTISFVPSERRAD